MRYETSMYECDAEHIPQQNPIHEKSLSGKKIVRGVISTRTAYERPQPSQMLRRAA